MTVEPLAATSTKHHFANYWDGKRAKQAWEDEEMHSKKKMVVCRRGIEVYMGRESRCRCIYPLLVCCFGARCAP